MKERKKYEVIRKLSEILNQFKERKDVLITIVDLSLPKKGGAMKVFLSIYPLNFAKNTIEYLNKISRSILKEVKENIYLRHLPSKIIFYSTEVFNQADQILKLIKEVENELKES